MARSISTKQAPVQSMGQQCHGVPVARYYRRHCPLHRLQIQAGTNMVIFCQIYIIIKIDEVIAQNAAIGCQASDHQHDNYQVCMLFSHGREREVKI